MKLKIVLFFVFCVSGLLFITTGFAETIYLNDGRILKGKILQRESYYIVADINGFPQKFYTGQIDRIEEDKLIDTIDMDNIDVEQYQEIGMPTDKAKLIVVLIDVSGVRQNLEDNIRKVIEGVPEEQKEYYTELFNIDEIIERLIPLYDKYYTEDELWKIVEFYESPAGKKSLEVTPKIMKESIGVSLEYFKEKSAI